MGLKNLLVLVLMVSVIYSEEDIPQISQAWFNKHGCPVTNRLFILDCNDCLCEKAHSNKTASCNRKACHTVTIDDYKSGKHCPAEEEFYSQCKVCRCNDKGNDAKCDSGVCTKYYANVKLN